MLAWRLSGDSSTALHWIINQAAFIKTYWTTYIIQNSLIKVNIDCLGFVIILDRGVFGKYLKLPEMIGDHCLPFKLMFTFGNQFLWKLSCLRV